MASKLGIPQLNTERADVKSPITAPMGFRDTSNALTGSIKDTVNGARGVGPKRAARMISPTNRAQGSRIKVRAV